MLYSNNTHLHLLNMKTVLYKVITISAQVSKNRNKKKVNVLKEEKWSGCSDEPEHTIFYMNVCFFVLFLAIFFPQVTKKWLTTQMYLCSLSKIMTHT